jgi:hypothetical protein
VFKTGFSVRVENWIGLSIARIWILVLQISGIQVYLKLNYHIDY